MKLSGPSSEQQAPTPAKLNDYYKYSDGLDCLAVNDEQRYNDGLQVPILRLGKQAFHNLQNTIRVNTLSAPPHEHILGFRCVLKEMSAVF